MHHKLSANQQHWEIMGNQPRFAEEPTFSQRKTMKSKTHFMLIILIDSSWADTCRHSFGWTLQMPIQ